MDATVAASVAPTDLVTVLQPGGLAFATIAQIQADPVGQVVALTAAVAALTARVAALEGRPEEVAHFGAIGRFPNVAAAATFAVQLTSLVPAVPGDTLKAGETVEVRAVGPLPAGVDWKGQPVVAADGVVTLTFSAGLVIANAAPVSFAITALR